jgi:type II secretory pathway pseudopilin PulG
MNSSMPSRAVGRAQGATLPELIVVIALIALITGFVLPSIKRGFDRIQARGAARTTMMAFFTARAEAIAHGQRTVVLLDSKRSRVTVVIGADTLVTRPIGTDFGVGMLATRDSMTFFPDGLGLGGANLSVIISRGAAVDTVIVSREGRVKLGARAR